VPRTRRAGVRVRRKIRRIELWPALKIAFLFHVVCFAITLVVLALGWRLMTQAGFIDKVSKFLIKIGFADGLTISGPTLWRGTVTVGVVLVLLNTLLTLLLVLLYNLLSSIFGGVIVSVIEERVGDAPARIDPADIRESAGSATSARATRPAPGPRSPRVPRSGRLVRATPGEPSPGRTRTKAPPARNSADTGPVIDFWADPLDPDATEVRPTDRDSSKAD
jgi:Transmembrane domain of unknown function (DUF3566)